MTQEIMNSLLRLTVSVLLLFLSSQAWARTEIVKLRHWTAPEYTRVVIDTDEEVNYRVEKSASKVQLQLTDAVLAKGLSPEYLLNKPGITRVLFSLLAPGSVRLELFISEKVETKIFKLKKFQDKPHRLVIDIILPEVEKEESQAREQVKVVKKDKIIVIDPGHGGEDPGATGKRGTAEKNVVLAVGKKLRDILNSGEGTRAFLTRGGDYYVPFKKRLSIARELGADLFISIHADAARNRIAKGTSVYCLSTGGAVSEAAKILARQENMADIIGGAGGESGGKGDSDPIILNMFQTNTINQSKSFGAKALDGLGRINSIKFSHVQEAPFRVLKFPEIPAVLIETAYISNLQEEANLREEKFQALLAAAIAGSVKGFFSLAEAPVAPVAEAAPTDAKLGKEAKSPAAEKLLHPVAKAAPTDAKLGKEAKSPAAEKVPRPAAVYTVKRGETLIGIAGHYRADVSLLLKLNNMKLNDSLYTGRVLSLPVGTEPDRKGEPVARKTQKPRNTAPARTAPVFHKVSEGDTIIKIARHYRTPVSVLLKLNTMKLRDPLYIGRDLRLPRPLL